MQTTKPSVEEMNQVIAQFMGVTVYPKAGTPEFKKWKGERCDYEWPELEYHESWDWLMPVVQKILNAPMDTFDTYVLWVTDALQTADINKVHQAVYDYIANHPTKSHEKKTEVNRFGEVNNIPPPPKNQGERI